MLYHAYEMQRAWLSGASAWASISAELLSNPLLMPQFNPYRGSQLPMASMGPGQIAASALEVFAHAAAPYGKPDFGIDTVSINGVDHPVTETTVIHKPFGNLKRFMCSALPENAPRLLIVAPMSGHFATLLRGTVARMAESCEVYVTDWADAKTVPLADGYFDLEDYIDYLIAFLEHIGPNANLMAVCQPSVPAFAAAAIMNRDNHPCVPATLTMMGGPIDTRESPTSVNTLAMERTIGWFRETMIATVPMHYPGSGRRVYPGFMQLASFMSMNLSSHMLSHYEMFKHLTAGDQDSAQAGKDFYDEYRSVCDMTAEFYLQTVEDVFQTHAIPNRTFLHRDQLVDPSMITRTAILAVEGERDDISGIGQTKAALTLADQLAENKKRYYLAQGAGHYGIFNGSTWRDQVAPVVEGFIAEQSH